MQKIEAQSDFVLLVAPIFASALFIVYMAKQDLPLPALSAILAIIIELGGGILLLVGYQTRLVATGLAIYVVVAALIAHRNFGDGNQLAHFWKNMAIVGGMLAFTAVGAGAYSVDGRRRTMSVIGPKRTSLFAPHMSAFRGKADVARYSPRRPLAPQRKRTGTLNEEEAASRGRTGGL